VVLLALLLQLAAAGFGWAHRRAAARVTAQAPEVARVETAQALANSIAERSQKRLMPFEMLALINPVRPEQIEFSRVLSRSITTLEVEGQTTDPSAVGTYEVALRGLPAVASAQARDVRTRDGATTFTLAIDFKPEGLRDPVPASEPPVEESPPVPTAEVPPPTAAHHATPGGAA
jgi:hypothetical protein